MKLIIAIIQPEKLDAVRQALGEHEVSVMYAGVVSDACHRRSGIYRGILYQFCQQRTGISAMRATGANAYQPSV